MVGKNRVVSCRAVFALTVFGLVLISGNAFASGGTCPAGANYTSPTNPSGPLVTLGSLGITTCYFVSAAGADTNTGTSESTPWQYAPWMPSCASNCATVQGITNGSSGKGGAGLGFIFRGGDTWHFGQNTGAYTGGTWNWDTGNGPSGTSSNPIYLGVDPTWYSGASWARPIFTGDNPLCNASTVGTMPDGYTCTSTTDSFGQPSYYVSGCAYQVGSTNVFVNAGYVDYIIFDNFEMTGLCQSSVGQPAHHDSYFSYASEQGPTTYQNNYLHGASHLQFAAKNGFPGCTSSAVCFNIYAFYGSVSVGSVGETVVNNVVDFSDSDPVGEGLCDGGFWNVAYNVFRYTTQCLPGVHLFHDNLYEYFFENGHSNMIESNDPAGTNVYYNNVFRHIENLLSSGGGVGLWPGSGVGGTDYFFNNVMYDVGGFEYFNLGGVGITTDTGSYVIFNNTFQSDVSQYILGCNNYTYGTVLDTNNFYIDNTSQYGVSGCTFTTLTPLLLSNSTATTDGYTSAETYAYSPTTASSPTVGAGTNETTGYCSTLSSAGLTAAASACEKDTTYACAYNATNHTVSCPARTPSARPSTGVWDIGAYEYTPVPGAASNLKATAY